MTTTLPPSRREWLKACVDRVQVERKAEQRAWRPDADGEEWKNVLLEIDAGQRCIAVPKGASAVIFVFAKPPH